MSSGIRFNGHVEAEATKRKCLEALAVALGSYKLTARLNASALLSEAELLAEIDHTKYQNGLNPADHERIESLGQWFLTGSHLQESLKFPVGHVILNILNADLTTDSVANLKRSISLWVGSSQAEKFDSLVNAASTE